MANHRMLPPASGNNSVTLFGQVFSATPGSVVNVPGDVAKALEANGWIRPRTMLSSDTTANRPTTGLFAGYTYLDTTLAKIIVYDGATWRDPATGASV